MNQSIKSRITFMPTGLHIREAREGETEQRTIEGCAIVFDQETTLYDGDNCRYRERIAPSAITAEFLAQQDVKLNLLHDRQTSLARNNRGEGTLQFDLREDGLYFSAEMPRCDLGDRALALVQNGTYSGCSFEFYAGEYTDTTTTLPDGREDVLTVHTKFQSITAITIAMDPAYTQTSVRVREAAAHDEALQQAKAKAAAHTQTKAAIARRDREIHNAQRLTNALLG